MTGTDNIPTQQRVWQVLSQVPDGKVVSYGQLAEMAGLPGAARWVGSTLRKLPDGTPLPWHRVITSQGRIAFPADSDSARRQRELLRREGVVITGNKVNMALYRWQP